MQPENNELKNVQQVVVSIVNHQKVVVFTSRQSCWRCSDVQRLFEAECH